MKIAIMGGWNTDSGASFHSESIGHEFVKQGHTLNVFTFYQYAFHGSQITGVNEDYVTECFTHSRFNPVKLDVIPFLKKDYELFIAEDIGMLPKDLLVKIFNTHIKKKAKTVSVFHDNQISDNASYFQFDWDAIVCFDKRYKPVLKGVYPDENIFVIPYPCNPWNPGDKESAREELNLPKDKKIILTFGPNTSRLLKVIKYTETLHEDYPLMILALTKDGITIKELNEIKKWMKIPIEIREEAPSINRLYKYLYASDLLFYFRDPVQHIVVASTILQCLGSGCPVLGNISRFTEMFEHEIFKYSNPYDIISNMREIFDKTDVYKDTMNNAKKYTIKNSSVQIAKKFIELYHKIKQ